MIVQETYELNGRQFVRTFSDEGRYVVGGSPEGEYVEANDPADFHRSYSEGRIIGDEADVADYQNALDRLGVEV